MSDYTALREALAAGPTPGPWSASMVPHGASVESAATAHVAWCGTCSSSAPGGSVSRLRAHATASYIAAASPETVAALLAERDALAAEVERLRKVLKPFAAVTLTPTGQIVGLMREDFDAAREAANG